MKTPFKAFFNIQFLRVFFSLLFLLFSLASMAQKKLHKMVLADKVALVQLNTAHFFEVNLNTISGNEVLVEAKMEGEYSRELDLDLKNDGETLFIEADFVPNFENPNDKLSAHKVVSILLNISVPEFKAVALYGTSSRVNAAGVFKDLQIVLSDGTINLTNIQGTVQLKTQSGAINVKTKAAHIEAESKYGKVSYNPIPKGDSSYTLKTVTGNIELSKTE